jgi:hypothetical protein
MALSDQLAQLSKRAKEAEDRARAASTEAKDELRASVEQASDAASKKADELKSGMDAAQGAASDWWSQMHDDWARHVSTVQTHLAAKKMAAHVKWSQADAAQAAYDASAAIDFATAAVEEAEYAVLDAILAQGEADEVAAGS